MAVAYAVRHPERVSHIILYGAFALGGKKRSPAEKERRDAMTTLMRLGWGADNPTFRQMFTGLFIAQATHEQADIFNELQLKATLPSEALVFDPVTISKSAIGSPTLKSRRSTYSAGRPMVPLEAGRQMDGGIPGARFIACLVEDAFVA